MPIIIYKNTSSSPIDLKKHSIPAPKTTGTLYLVATAGLERYRSEEVNKGSSNARLQLSFLNAIQERLKTKCGYALWSRTEESAFLNRAGRSIYKKDYARSIQRDWKQWHKLLSRFAETPSSEHQNVISEIVTPNLANIGNALYGQWLQEINAGQVDKQARNGNPNKQWFTFEQAYLQAMEDSKTFFNGLTDIVMEGFTFLHPLHRHFLHLAGKKCTLHFIVPWSDDQTRGFETVATLIQDIHSLSDVDIAEKSIPHVPTESTSALEYAKQNLFADTSKQSNFSGNLDSSLKIHTHVSRQDEIERIITDIKKLLKPNDGSLPITGDQIVIVSRSSMEFESQLLLEAEYQGILEHFMTDTHNVLLTPVGKLLLALYGSVVENEPDQRTGDDIEDTIELSSGDLLTLFRSGLFGNAIKDSLRSFEGVEAKFFDTTCTRNEWRSALQTLLDEVQKPHAALTENRGRTPENFVSKDEIELWQTTITTVFDAVHELINKGAMDILDHTTAIQELLAKLSGNQVSDVVQVMFNTIEKLFNEIFEHSRKSERSIAFSIPEMHQILVGFGKGRDANIEEELQLLENTENAPNDDPESALPMRENNNDIEDIPKQIRILGLEGVDTLSVDYVFWLAADDSHHPKFRDNWPFKDTSASQLSLERYLFLSTIRASTIQLTMSWSQADQRQSYNPSIYLLELATMLGVSLKPAENTRSIEDFPRESSAKMTFDALEYDHYTYTLSELSIYKHCPRRWLLEKIEERNGAFEHTFHNRWMLQMEWIENTFSTHADSRPMKWSLLKSQMRATLQNTSPHFLGVHKSSKRVSHAIVEMMLAMTNDKHQIPVDWDSDPIVELRTTPNKHIDVYGHHVDIEYGFELRIEGKTYPLTFPVTMRTWLSRTYGFTDNEEILTGLVDHVRWIHASQGNLGQMAFKTEVYHTIQSLQKQDFTPREQDASCHICPVRTTCITMKGGQA